MNALTALGAEIGPAGGRARRVEGWSVGAFTSCGAETAYILRLQDLAARFHV